MDKRHRMKILENENQNTKTLLQFRSTVTSLVMIVSKQWKKKKIIIYFDFC